MDNFNPVINAENILYVIAMLAVVRYIGIPLFIECRNLLKEDDEKVDTPE